MSKEIQISQEKGKTSHELSVIEQVVMQGDLSKLNPEQRVMYYNKVCESQGLNPFTRPFEYISMNGKLTLYAKKDATEQLRKLNGISIEKLEGKVVDDLYIVVAIARTRDGRVDQSTGAVTIGNLKGEAKANAIMKAETKAKRRVTLSISGMGWTDESEIESIPNATPVDVDLMTGEIKSNKTIQAQVEEIPTLSQDEIAEFCTNFNGDKEMTAAYIQMCMEKRKWTVSEAIMNMQKDLKKSHEAYKKWLEKVEKNKPVVEEVAVVEAPSMEPKSVFEEVK